MTTNATGPSKRLRNLSPVCLLTAHKMCTSAALRHASCECDCHYVVDQSWLNQPTEQIINDLCYSLWSVQRSRDGVKVGDFQVALLIAEAFQRSGKFDDLDTQTSVKASEELGAALMPSLGRNYWSQTEARSDFLPVLEKYSIPA